MIWMTILLLIAKGPGKYLWMNEGVIYEMYHEFREDLQFHLPIYLDTMIDHLRTMGKSSVIELS
jgi:hypothetical protein